MGLIIVLVRTIFFYFFILLCYRLMGKREIGELSVSDLTISLLIAELVAISIENETETIFLTIIPIVVLVFLEIGLSFLELKFHRVKKIIDGKPSVIINKGKINLKEMFRQRYSLEDLILALRCEGIKGINEVDYAILETNGNLSVFKKNHKDSNYPLPLIVDGEIDEGALLSIKKDYVWLRKKCLEYEVNIKNVLYAFYKNKVIYIIKR